MANSSELVAPKRFDNMDIKGDWEVEGTNIPRLDHRHFNVKLSNATTEVLFDSFQVNGVDATESKTPFTYPQSL